MKWLLPFACVLIVAQSFAQGPPPTADVLGVHNLTLGSGSKLYS